MLEKHHTVRRTWGAGDCDAAGKDGWGGVFEWVELSRWNNRHRGSLRSYNGAL